MDFNTLHETLPYVIGKKEYVVDHRPYSGVKLSFPGRHQLDTEPRGGDFVVIVTCKSIGWNHHSFTHQDIFNDIQAKYDIDPVEADRLVTEYAKVVHGADPDEFPKRYVDGWDKTLDQTILLRAAQCLAVAEHRRYKKFESKGGGRFLPVRFITGIVEGLWTAEDAKKWQRKGRPGLDALISIHGAPVPLEKRVLTDE